MDYKSVSAGELSSLLDVQRSNISHILNGRNKPGASFIEKLLVNFSDLNARWLLTGDGEMVENIVLNEDKTVSEPNSVNDVSNKLLNKPQLVNSIVTGQDKPIDKIVLLFSDGTFTDFNKK